MEEKSFQKSKKLILSTRVSVRFDGRFCLLTHRSMELERTQFGAEKTVTFASRSLNKAGIGYTQIEK